MYKGGPKPRRNKPGLLNISVSLVFMNTSTCGFHTLGRFVLDKICDKMEY